MPAQRTPNPAAPRPPPEAPHHEGVQVGADDVIDLPANDTREAGESGVGPWARPRGGPGGAGSRGSGPEGWARGTPAHTTVWRRSEKTRSVKSASSPARAALGTTR